MKNQMSENYENCPLYCEPIITLMIESGIPMIYVCKCCVSLRDPLLVFTLDEFEEIPNYYELLKSCENKYPSIPCRGSSKPWFEKIESNKLCNSSSAHPVKRFTLDLSPACNAKCTFCYCKDIREEYLKLDNETKLRIKKIEERFLTDCQNKGLQRYTTQIGEPIMNEDTFAKDVLKYDGLPASVTTNGINLSLALIEELKGRASFKVSLNAFDRASYKKVMGVDKWDNVISVVKASGCPVSVVICDKLKLKDYKKVFKAIDARKNKLFFMLEMDTATKKSIKLLKKLNKKAERLWNGADTAKS